MVQHYSKLNDPKLLEQLKQGAVGVLPSDTIYGLICLANNQESVERLYSLKKRENKPGTVIAASIDQLVALGLKARYLKPVEHYWPNPISIIIPTGLDLPYLHQGKMSLAVRIPKDEKLQALLRQTGALLTSSANQPDKPPANTVPEAEKYFGDNIDFYVDGGDLSGKPPSTIIRVVDDAVEVLREGAIKLNEAGEVQ